MRISKKERKENAKKWYQIFMNSNCNKSAIVVKRYESTTNPNVHRVQFLAVASTLAFTEEPIIIAESNVLGIEGCFMELVEFIKGGIIQKTYFEYGFNEWLMETMNFEITYKDGLVFMFEKEMEK
jgi:hypothetical protein